MTDRIQVRRRADVPEGVVLAIAKPWGNPFRVLERRSGGWRVIGTEVKFDDRRDASCMSTALFEAWLAGVEDVGGLFPLRRAEILGHIGDLRGKTLACYCSPKVRCHADVLMELANR